MSRLKKSVLLKEMLSSITALFLLSACSQFSIENNIEPFKKLYDIQKRTLKEKEDREFNTETYTFSCSDMKLSDFVMWFSDKTGMGIVYSTKADDVLITGEWKKATADQIINTLARRYNLDVLKEGNTFYIGSMKQDDRGGLVRNVSGYDADELKSAVDVLIGEHGKSTVFSNGVCVVSDKESTLQKIDRMLTSIEFERENSWIIQLYFISINKQKLRSQGVEVKPTANLAYDISQSTDALDYDAKLDAVLNASFRSSYGHLVGTPMFILRDGAKAEWSDGEEIPIPKKSVSNYGTVETLDYDYVSTGLNVKVELRESLQGAIIKLNISDSRVIGFNELAPELRDVSLNSEFEIKQNGIYILGELNVRRRKEGINQYLSFSNDNDDTVLQIWGRTFRIDGDAKVDIDEYKNYIKKDNLLMEIIDG